MQQMRYSYVYFASLRSRIIHPFFHPVINGDNCHEVEIVPDSRLLDLMPCPQEANNLLWRRQINNKESQHNILNPGVKYRWGRQVRSRKEKTSLWCKFTITSKTWYLQVILSRQSFPIIYSGWICKCKKRTYP